MVDFRVRVEGLRDLERELLDLGHDIGSKQLLGALRDAGKIVEDAMVNNAPVGDVQHSYKYGGEVHSVAPGHLRSRIKRNARLNRRGVNNRNFKGDAVALVRIGVRKVPYVGAIEFGTDNPPRPAQPFIRRSLLENVDPVLDRFKSSLRKRIDRQVRKRAKVKPR